MNAESINASAPRGVVGVVVRAGRLLVIRRSQMVIAPGAFCFPGGAIEAGESEPQALVREMREELDVAVRPNHCLWRSVSARGVALCWWSAELTVSHERITPAPAEVESAHWFGLDELRALPGLLESNRQFLAALAEGEFALPGMGMVG